MADDVATKGQGTRVPSAIKTRFSLSGQKLTGFSTAFSVAVASRP